VLWKGKQFFLNQWHPCKILNVIMMEKTIPNATNNSQCCDLNVETTYYLIPLILTRCAHFDICNVLCVLVVFLLYLVCPIFPVPLGCSFLIAPSVFSYVCSLQRIQVYINKYTIFDLTILYFLQNKTALVIKSEVP
jgi:hypothetical protein